MELLQRNKQIKVKCLDNFINWLVGQFRKWEKTPCRIQVKQKELLQAIIDIHFFVFNLGSLSLFQVWRGEKLNLYFPTAWILQAYINWTLFNHSSREIE